MKIPLVFFGIVLVGGLAFAVISRRRHRHPMGWLDKAKQEIGVS